MKIKDAAKKIGKQFACGSSVSKAPSGAEEVVIQGDVLMDLPRFLETTFNVRSEREREKENGRVCAVAPPRSISGNFRAKTQVINHGKSPHQHEMNELLPVQGSGVKFPVEKLLERHQKNTTLNGSFSFPSLVFRRNDSVVRSAARSLKRCTSLLDYLAVCELSVFPKAAKTGGRSCSNPSIVNSNCHLPTCLKIQ